MDEPLESLPLFPGTDSDEAAGGREPKATPLPEARYARRGVPRRLRFRAGLLDLLVQGGVGLLASGGAAALGAPDPLAPGPMLLFLACFSFLYHAVPLLFWGRTLGMSVAGIRALSTNGGGLSGRQVVRRWIGSWLTFVLLGIPIAVASGGSRTISDRLSDSETLPRRDL